MERTAGGKAAASCQEVEPRGGQRGEADEKERRQRLLWGSHEHQAEKGSLQQCPPTVATTPLQDKRGSCPAGPLSGPGHRMTNEPVSLL